MLVDNGRMFRAVQSVSGDELADVHGEMITASGHLYKRFAIYYTVMRNVTNCGRQFGIFYGVKRLLHRLARVSQQLGRSPNSFKKDRQKSRYPAFNRLP